MLGCTLTVHTRPFIIRMLEIYYGGAGDDDHDWHRTRYQYKKSKYQEHTAVQSQEGFRVYISSLDETDTYARFDIVVGAAGVPISFLVRSVWDDEFTLVGTPKGSPNIVLRKLALRESDHGKEIMINDSVAPISLSDKPDPRILEKELEVVQQLRINLSSDFEKRHSLEWNFCLA
jgi:hypothetical protein